MKMSSFHKTQHINDTTLKRSSPLYFSPDQCMAKVRAVGTVVKHQWLWTNYYARHSRIQAFLHQPLIYCFNKATTKKNMPHARTHYIENRLSSVEWAWSGSRRNASHKNKSIPSVFTFGPTQKVCHLYCRLGFNNEIHSLGNYIYQWPSEAALNCSISISLSTARTSLDRWKHISLCLSPSKHERKVYSKREHLYFSDIFLSTRCIKPYRRQTEYPFVKT